MIIDAHQHFWKYDSIKHSWISESMAVLRNDFLPDDLKKIYAENGVDGCVAVQVEQTLEETDFLLDLAQEYDFIKGVVGWVDFRAKNIDVILEHYKPKKKVKGFRHIVQEEADHNFLLRPDFVTGISYLEKYDFVYDILIFPHQLGASLELIKKFPHQKFIIDHLAKPYIKDGFFDGWALLMTEIAKHENVYCKLSGMITEADFNSWKRSHSILLSRPCGDSVEDTNNHELFTGSRCGNRHNTTNGLKSDKAGGSTEALRIRVRISSSNSPSIFMC